jgi:hypothetical protein
MLSAQTLQKVIVVSAAAVGLTMPLTACVAGDPAASEAKMAERTLTVADAAGACDHVDAPMLNIPTASDAEPRMQIPQPPGWEPITELGDVAYWNPPPIRSVASRRAMNIVSASTSRTVSNSTSRRSPVAQRRR